MATYISTGNIVPLLDALNQVLTDLAGGSAASQTFANAAAAAPAIGPVTTVAALPAAAAGNVGQIKRVSDANAPAVGSTVAGGGAAPALVWSNGTAWTVIGK